MVNPFENNANKEVFAEMLKLRFAFWTRQRRNMLARRRYAEKKKERYKKIVCNEWD
jgi:hypothetical protein